MYPIKWKESESIDKITNIKLSSMLEKFTMLKKLYNVGEAVLCRRC